MVVKTVEGTCTLATASLASPPHHRGCCYIAAMLAPGARTAPSQARVDLRLLIVLLGALIVCVLVGTHVSPINGPWYWKWGWQRIPIARYWIMLPTAIPFFAAQRLGGRRSIAIGLLVVCSIQLRLTYTILQDDHLGLDWLAATVRSPITVSYYSDAAAIGQDPRWLADYPEILPLTNLHTQSKPPGPVAYYLAWIRMLGYGDRSAKAAGIGLIVLESLVVPLVYLLARTLTDDPDVAFIAASFYALCPGAVLLIPMLDPVYAGLACLVLWSWNRALREGSLLFATVCGLLGAGFAFCSYTLFTLAPFVVFQMLLIDRPAKPIRALGRLLLAVAVGFAIFYGICWAAARFDPVATFISALKNQHALLAAHRADRPYPQTILFDLTDFALAMGWVGAAIIVLGLSRANTRSIGPRRRWLLMACALQPVIVAISGTLQSETLRVWNFMLPLMAIVAGIELAHWTPRSRMAAYGAMFLVLLAIGQNLIV
jgi:hypothetical protein